MNFDSQPPGNLPHGLGLFCIELALAFAPHRIESRSNRLERQEILECEYPRRRDHARAVNDQAVDRIRGGGRQERAGDIFSAAVDLLADLGRSCRVKQSTIMPALFSKRRPPWPARRNEMSTERSTRSKASTAWASDRKSRNDALVGHGQQLGGDRGVGLRLIGEEGEGACQDASWENLTPQRPEEITSGHWQAANFQPWRSP